MDAQSYYTDAAAWSAQFAVAAPDKRLTIIAPDGSVLSDTWGEVTASHADRPEFQDALAKGSGEAIRPSDTTRTTMLYEARRFTDGNIGRVSMPISSVNALVLQGVAGFLAAAAVAVRIWLRQAARIRPALTMRWRRQQRSLRSRFTKKINAIFGWEKMQKNQNFPFRKRFTSATGSSKIP